MSDVRPEPEMTVSFQVAYESDVADAHAMDVQSLAPALLGFGELIREANAELNAGRSTVNLRVVSDFEHKCFNINFDLVMTLYDQVKGFLKLEDVHTAHDLLQWLEILGVPTGAVGGLIGYLKVRRGRKIASVTNLTDADKRGRVSIEFDGGDEPKRIEVHHHVYRLGENKNVLRSVSRAIKPVEKGGEFDRLEFRENGSPRGIVKRDDAEAIQKTCDLASTQPEPSKPQPIEAVLQALGPVYDLGAQTWRFWYGEQQITADISGTDIAARALERGGVAVHDAYKVVMEVTQHVTPTGQIRNSYKIVEVQDFIPAQPTGEAQSDLFTYLNRSE